MVTIHRLESWIVCVLDGIAIVWPTITRTRQRVAGGWPTCHANSRDLLRDSILFDGQLCCPTAVLRIGSIVRDNNLKCVSVGSLSAAVMVDGSWSTKTRRLLRIIVEIVLSGPDPPRTIEATV